MRPGKNDFDNELEEATVETPDFDQHDAEDSRLRPRKEARLKVMDYLAKRDHSELELLNKLLVNYSREEAEDAVVHAREKKWLRDPQELAEQVAETLERKGKGSRYIGAYLASRGLPNVIIKPEEELRKAIELVAMKLRLSPPFSSDDQSRITRLLANRGFDNETIGKVIHEKS